MSSFALLLIVALLWTATGQLNGDIGYEKFVGGSGILTTESGRPIGDNRNTITAGSRGPVLLQDIVLLEQLSHFTRERIPDRVVHGKGNGAFGYFEVTDDITRYTKAKVFDGIGKRTRIVVRFSLATKDVGSADTVRDGRGFAIRFFTEEGDWNLLGLSAPVFPVRDPLLFLGFAHSQLRNPVTNIKNRNDEWDFNSLVPETTASTTFLFGDRGIPLSYRYMDGFGINTFKLVNEANESVFCKFIYQTDQGIRNLTSEEATRLAGVDPDYHGRDLFEAIDRGDYPSWTFYIQVMTEEEAKNYRFNLFDPTKEWPQDEFPLIRVGKLVLNENPVNFFAEIEQLAFCPVRLVPGIEPSPDKVLQGRLFVYTDAQRYRLGVNFNQIPVNIPSKSPVRNYERNGFMTVNGNQGGGPTYFPNSYEGPQEDPAYLETPFDVCGVATRYNTSDEDNFTQPRIFYEQMNEDQKGRLIQNIVDSLSQAEEFIQQRQVNNFRQVSEDFADRLTVGLASKKQEMAQKQTDQEMDFIWEKGLDEVVKTSDQEKYGEVAKSGGRREVDEQTKFVGHEQIGLQEGFNRQVDFDGQRPLLKNMRL